MPVTTVQMLKRTAVDKWRAEVNGAALLLLVPMQMENANQNAVPEQLVAGGHHFDVVGGSACCHNLQQRYNYFS